ncbi:regulator of nonsense transcripts 3A isoform X2 [Dermacentor silvarum]|uniref:regulator of nonsense transcripts 3A isoform X2 n=1 Tax=Dermacentor silvarum TaxID=543639 RepID=UPI002100FD63|nr:regulator of nonsense transcripts 3A isoform X2 [Dermacentor silvarum]
MTQEKAKDECSPRSRSSSEASKSKEKKDKSFLTKVVIRRLPPTMTEDQFLEQISPVPESDYMYFVKGDLSLGPHAFSRAYINFVNQDEIFIFKEKFDDYIFVDEKGNEFPALVEYAPFQKIPKRRTRKKDPKCGTIEQDPEYIKFLESLEQPEEVTLPSIDTYIEEIEAREKEIKANNGCLKVVTPLIEYLQQRKLEKLKLREERREERKRREVEKKRLRDEEKRRRKVDRDRATKEPSIHRESSSARYDDDLAQFDDAEPAPTKPPVVKSSAKSSRRQQGPASSELRRGPPVQPVDSTESRNHSATVGHDRSHRESLDQKPAGRSVSARRAKGDRAAKNEHVPAVLKVLSVVGRASRESPTSNKRLVQPVVLRNPVREHEPPAATTPKDSGTGVVPKSSAGTGGSHSKAPPVRSSTGGGSSARKDWDRPKLPRPSKDYPSSKEYSKHKAEQPASSHRRGSTGSDGRGQETSTPKASATTPATDDERSVVESSRGVTSTTSLPAEGKNTSSEKDRERPSAPEESSQSRAKDPRAERRIRNKDRPSIEIYRPGMRRLSQKGTSSQEETPAASSKPPKSNSSSKPPA